MTKTNRFKASAVVAGIALALCLLTFVAVRPAGAAYPGQNGEIAFMSDRDLENSEIYTIRPSGGAPTRLTFRTGGNVEPAYSPDGSKIAFTRGGEIFVMPANGMKSDGTGATQVTFDTATATTVKKEPTWSPDGTKIAYVVQEADYEIYVTNADGTGTPQRLTNNSYHDTQPAWSPRGDQVAFVSAHTGPEEPNRDTNRNIYVMDADPTTNDAALNLTPNTSSPVYQGHDDDPSWSPNGEWIAYSNQANAINIWKVTPDGTDKRALATTDDEETDPAWSPDGFKIAYVGSSATNTDRDIWVMDADGNNPRVVHDDTSHDINPDWQPNSAPTINRMRPAPGSETTDRTPLIAATVTDKQTDLAKTQITLSLDGEVIARSAFSYDRATNRLSYTPPAVLPLGMRTVRIIARDEMGLRTTEEWAFRIVR